MQKYKILKEIRIRETKNLSTNADSSTYTKKILLVRKNLPNNNLFLCGKFYTLYEQKLSNLTLDIGLWEGGAKGRLNRVNK